MRDRSLIANVGDRVLSPLRRMRSRRRFASSLLRSGAGPLPNPLFDSDWYLQRYPEVRAAGLDPLSHYLEFGAAKLDPNPLFDTGWYLDRYPDIRAAGLNPLVHYLERGGSEGRNPHPLFDSHWYLEQNPDVRAAGLNPLVHYLREGSGRDPNPLFDSAWYLEQNPDVRAAGANPLVHYVTVGAAQGRDPNRLFKTRWYLEHNRQVASTGLNPLAHYIYFGVADGCDPNPLFDTDWYLAHNPDVVRGQLNPLGHYLRQGAAEGRASSPQHKGSWFLEQFPERAPQWPLPKSAPPLVQGAATGCELVSDRCAAPAGILAAAIERAGAAQRHLLVVMVGVPPPAEEVGRLIAAFDADPMIGYVMPRLAEAAGLIHPLQAGRASGSDRVMLAHLPALQLAPEFLAGCVLIRRELVANLPQLAGHFTTMAGLLRALMAWGRRLGYRAAIANRVVVADVSRADAHPALGATDQAALIRLFPDALTADRRFDELSCHRHEALVGSVLSQARRRMLIDCTGMQPFHNGTSECSLGILDGLAAAGSAWQVDIMASAATAEFHALRKRYGAFNIVHAPSEGGYAIAIRLSQPWMLSEIAELHEHALHLVFMMLDTIAWDMVYAATPEIERTWSFAAAHADGFLYDSAFTRDRFRFRFPLAAHARELVARLSCNFGDYDATPAQRGAGHILLIGNDHEHKGMAQALDLLPRAFPHEQFVVIGHDDGGIANVRSVKSGKVSVEDMRDLHVGARMLVFPSFYEGFGFPVVKGLAHGLDVVARRSELLREIAGQCAPRGRIVPFEDPATMVDAVGRVLAGKSVDTVPLGTGLAPGEAPPGWREIAAHILALLEEMTAAPSFAIRDRREAALRHVWPAGYPAFKASKTPPP